MHETTTISRPFDALLSAIALLLASPLMVAIAVAIRWESPGPVIFTQSRLGLGGKLFPIHKFRTLKEGGDEPEAMVPEGAPRITRVGRWLRRIRLDELPQLVDVIMGRMALVGPRPDVPANLQAVTPEDRRRLLSVRPGLTGPTQLAFIAEDTLLAEVADPTRIYRQIIVPAKVRADLTWLRSRSFAGDLLVLSRTPIVLFSRRARARSRTLVGGILAASQIGNPEAGPCPRATEPTARRSGRTRPAR